MDITSNSRVTMIVPLKLVITKNKWESVVTETPFTFGNYSYEKTKNGKENTSVVTLYVIQRQLKRALDWIYALYRKCKIPTTTKSGSSRLSCNMPKVLRPRQLRYYNLIICDNKIVSKDSESYYIEKNKTPTLATTLSKEDLPYKKAISTVNKMLDKIRLQYITNNTTETSWII